MHAHPAFQQPHEHGGDYASWLIQHKADQLVGRYGFTESDREDIEQELTLALLERWPQYDPARSKPCTFVAKIVDHKVADLVKRQRQERRFRESIDLSHADRLTETTCPSHEEEVDLRLDVETVLASLPPNYRELCERLKHESLLAASEHMGVPESTLRFWLTKIRQAFEDAGFEKLP